MRVSVEKTPAWVICVVTGVPFGAAMGFISRSDGDSLRGAAISGAVVGLAFGIAMAFTLRRQLQHLVRAVGPDTSRVDRRAAGRALRRGPVPADPNVRAAAIRLARHQLELLGRWRLRSVIIWSLLLAISIVGIFDGSRWRIALVALYLFLLGYQVIRPRMLRSRLEELTQGFEEDGS
ncbi:hypothetical protein OHA70_16710 [Kribbella sp. NBC_00382]|uniref:hypothetical protein n=1 Tax=Kribbella sp. NBC_00382 TaxID=2975967 RepID=UPI002E1E17BA